jgi:pSer/pThr/pTyr-binding forkhead associated (FHA) protein
MPRVTITIPGGTPQPYRFQTDREVVSIGRGSDNDITIPCGSVSARHAEMRLTARGYELHDLGSTNGTKLDGERLAVVPLRHGARATLGDVGFDFELSAEESAEIAARAILAGPESKEPVEMPPAPAVGALPPPPASGGASAGMILLFLVLAAAAFFAGMAVRFQKDTGGSLMKAIRTKTIVLPARAPVPAEAMPQSTP